jgi:hypothetical protein
MVASSPTAGSPLVSIVGADWLNVMPDDAV